METETSSRSEEMTELAIRGARAAEARRELASRIGKAVEEAVLKMTSQTWNLVVGFGGSFDVDVPEGRDERALRLKVAASRIASAAEILAARGLASSSDSNRPRQTYEEKVKDLQDRAAAANAKQATFYP